MRSNHKQKIGLYECDRLFFRSMTDSVIFSECWCDTNTTTVVVLCMVAGILLGPAEQKKSASRVCSSLCTTSRLEGRPSHADHSLMMTAMHHRHVQPLSLT